MITATCPECENQIVLDPSPEIGNILMCNTCQTVLEVTWLYPVSLDTLEEPVTENKPNSAHTEISDSGKCGERKLF